MASQGAASKSKGPLLERPEIRHVVIHHRRHGHGVHKPPTEKLVKAKDAYCPSNIPLYWEAGTKTAEGLGGREKIEETENLSKSTEKTPIVPFGPSTTLSYPNSCIGKITVGYNIGTEWQILWTGTGMMVQPRLMMTASHTIPWDMLSTDNNIWITFAPGHNSDLDPFGVAHVYRCYGYIVSQNVSEFDMAICLLDQDIGESCGWGSTIWNTSDSGYDQNPFKAFLGFAGYAQGQISLFPYEDPQWTIIKNDYDITVPQESGHFKLLEMQNPGDEGGVDIAGGAVIWTNFNNMVCLAGVYSGGVDNDPPEGIEFAGGEGLNDLVNWGIQNFGGY